MNVLHWLYEASIIDIVRARKERMRNIDEIRTVIK
jgi:hypothetical protein